MLYCAPKCNTRTVITMVGHGMIKSTGIHQLVRFLTNHFLPHRSIKTNDWFDLLGQSQSGKIQSKCIDCFWIQSLNVWLINEFYLVESQFFFLFYIFVSNMSQQFAHFFYQYIYICTCHYYLVEQCWNK